MPIVYFVLSCALLYDIAFWSVLKEGYWRVGDLLT